MQRDIRDIIEELDIIINIVRQQEEVIRRFTQLAKEILERKHLPSSQDAKEVHRMKLKSFGKRSQHVLSKVVTKIKELQGLRQSAEGIAQNVSSFVLPS